MNLYHLRAFFHVAATGSFSRAAERLGVSQPNISMQVRKLEGAVGLALVESAGRELQLTPAGELLYDYARRIFHLVEQAAGALGDLQALRRGHLVVGASTIPGAYLLPAAIADLRSRYPGVTVQLEIANTRRTEERLAKGEVDLAVLGESALDVPDLIREPLVQDTLVLVAPPGHPLAGGQPLPATQLPAVPLILREPGSSTREVLEQRLAALGLRVAPALELGSNEAVKQAVAAGLGLGVLSRFTVAWELAAGRLAEVPLTGVTLDRFLYLCRSVSRQSAPLVTAMADLLKRRFAGGT